MTTLGSPTIAFHCVIYLLSLHQDIVQQITGTNNAGRKKRSDEEDNQSEDSILEFLQSGGADVFYEELPVILMPLLVSFRTDWGEIA